MSLELIDLKIACLDIQRSELKRLRTYTDPGPNQQALDRKLYQINQELIGLRLARESFLPAYRNDGELLWIPTRGFKEVELR